MTISEKRLQAIAYGSVRQSQEEGVELARMALNAINTKPMTASIEPDEMLCDFYEVDNWTDLVRELVKHVAQLQDSAKRNVKPWEDAFPETLLPAYIERVKQADEACRATMLTGSGVAVPVNDVTTGKPLTITLPDISSKAFWSGSGKAEVFRPETYKRWVKEAIKRYCAIARVDVEVK